MLSAYCMLNSLQFDIAAGRKRLHLLAHPAPVYKRLMHQSAPVSNFTLELIASRFSDVMWLLDQDPYKHLDSRLAGFLLTECELNDTSVIRLTHEEIAHHLGSAREVVTRMLKYLPPRAWWSWGRGCITVTDPARLEEIGGASLR